MHENELLMIQPNDNVAVALKALSKGSECSVGGKNIILKDDIPAAHKVALTEIGKDENVIKYGLPIGHAISPIHMGEHVHIHNMTTNLEGLLEYQYHPEPDLWKNFMPEEEAYMSNHPPDCLLPDCFILIGHKDPFLAVGWTSSDGCQLNMVLLKRRNDRLFINCV